MEITLLLHPATPMRPQRCWISTQPMEEDGNASLSGNSDETVDWSQSAGGGLGDPPVLDLHMHEFLSGTEASGSRGDKPD